MESQNAVVCCSPTRAGREFQKTPVLKAPCAVPRGITSNFGGHGFRSREGCAGVSSAVPAPLAAVPWVPGPWMFLWPHWGSGGCITELLPSWWFLGSSQSAGCYQQNIKYSRYLRYSPTHKWMQALLITFALCMGDGLQLQLKTAVLRNWTSVICSVIRRS